MCKKFRLLWVRAWNTVIQEQLPVSGMESEKSHKKEFLATGLFCCWITVGVVREFLERIYKWYHKSSNLAQVKL